MLSYIPRNIVFFFFFFFLFFMNVFILSLQEIQTVPRSSWHWIKSRNLTTVPPSRFPWLNPYQYVSLPRDPEKMQDRLFFPLLIESFCFQRLNSTCEICFLFPGGGHEDWCKGNEKGLQGRQTGSDWCMYTTLFWLSCSRYFILSIFVQAQTLQVCQYFLSLML